MSGPVTIGIELGGTKGIAVLARGRDIVERVRVPTTTPAETLGALLEQAARWAAAEAVAAIGLASFGPLRLDPARTGYGRIAATPKPGWADADVRGAFAGLGLPLGFDTDVNGAVLAEARWGAAQGCDTAAYMTVGTGIGVGLMAGGRPLHGLLHPEVGHLRVRRVEGDSFPGICPFHGDCLEGLAAGPAIAARAGAPASELDADHDAWGFVSDALAEAMAILLLTASPQRILIGGGVGAGVPHLLPRVRAATAAKLASYLDEVDAAALDRIIVPPALGDDAGPLGAVALALDAVGLA
ncbi:ROK family protein [Sphingomonas jatrophae]|uniref:fructokinase n=1 Tax=Sphingomonas jatrophae TaxID=1166337 RepID=A0A1I6JDC6_9SPHN|nr:ROK family protein [Sphingomonas jatrophae]SFR76957.1 fructokinase [Sphingomonas jatrophae]